MSRVRIRSLVLSLVAGVLLAACDGGGGGGAPAPVPAPNTAPTASASAPAEVTSGATVTLDASASTDPDGDALSWAWRQTEGPAATLSDPAAASPTFEAPAVSAATTVSFAVTVSDPAGASDEASLSITVRPAGGAPVASASAPASADAGDEVVLDASASSDPDGDTLAFAWEQLSGTDVQLSDATAAAPSFEAPDVAAVETLSFRVTVEDPGGASDTATVAVEIRPVLSGQALLGPLVGATVEVYDGSNPSAAPIHTTTTEDAPDLADAGAFRIPAGLVDGGGVYVIRVLGGQDVDADDDGVRDATPTPFDSAIRLIATGDDLAAGPFTVNALTEVAYQSVRFLALSGYGTVIILDGLDIGASRLLSRDLDGDGDIDRRDLLNFRPLEHLDAFRRGRSAYGDLVAGLLDGSLSPSARVAFSDARLASLALEDQPGAVVLAGDLAFVGDRDSDGTGVSVVDVADPLAPVLRASVDIPSFGVTDLAVDGSLLYVAAGQGGLYVVDVSDPDAPVIVRSVPVTDAAMELVLVDDLLYVAGRSAGLEILDVSTPDAPLAVGAVDTPGLAFRLAVGDGVAVVADNASFQVIDVSLPSAPSVVATVAPPTAAAADDVAIIGDTAWTVTRRGLVPVDLSVPAAASAGERVELGRELARVEVVDGLLHIVDTRGGILIVDPTQEFLGSTTRTVVVGALETAGEAERLAVRDGLAYVTDVPNGLVITDATATAVLEPVAVEDTPNAVDIATADARAWLADLPNTPEAGGVRSLDVAFPDEPGTAELLPGATFARGVAARSGVVLAADDTAGLRVYDSADVDAPLLAATLDLSARARGVDLVDDLAVVAHDGGLTVVDLATLAAPSVLATVADPGAQPRDVRLDGDLAYVANGGAGLRIVDLSTPSAPSVVADLDTAGTAESVLVVGGLAYVADGSNGVVVVDVATPSAPTVLGTLETRDDATGLLFAGDTLHVAAGTSGVQVVDLSAPAMPRITGTIHTPGYATRLAEREGLLLVASGPAGLVVVRGQTDSRLDFAFDEDPAD